MFSRPEPKTQTVARNNRELILHMEPQLHHILLSELRLCFRRFAPATGPHPEDPERYCGEKLAILAELQVATPQPRKSVSPVQIGQSRASAAARTGQSSGSREPCPSRASAPCGAEMSGLTAIPGAAADAVSAAPYPHRPNFGLPARLPRRNEMPQRLALARDRQRPASFQPPRQVLPELANPGFSASTIACCWSRLHAPRSAPDASALVPPYGDNPARTSEARRDHPQQVLPPAPRRSYPKAPHNSVPLPPQHPGRSGE
jgi:hypothetical protein